jgi:hypothetical protein
MRRGAMAGNPPNWGALPALNAKNFKSNQTNAFLNKTSRRPHAFSACAWL